MIDIVDEILLKISSKSPMHCKLLRKNILSLDSESRKTAADYISTFLTVLPEVGVVADIDKSIDAYLGMVNMVMGEQLYFAKYGKYRYSSFDEVEKLVYSNIGYMTDYMIGLGLSQFLWYNHHQLFSFFKETIGRCKGAEYLEIGTGHGFFFMEAIKSGAFQRYSGVDVSAASLRLTKAMVSKFVNKFDKYVLINKDIFKFDDEPIYDFIAMGEVLEHVEHPERFLAQIRNLLKKGGKAYISTCANAPTIDHIYHFASIDEIRSMIKQSGFSVESEITISVDNIPEEKWEDSKTNLTYAAILT